MTYRGKRQASGYSVLTFAVEYTSISFEFEIFQEYLYSLGSV